MKKIISLIIAVTLILSLCPLTFAAEATEEFTGYNYVFTRAALKSENEISYTNLLENEYSVDPKISAPWQVASWHRGSTSVKESYLRYSSTYKNGVACFAIKIDVENGGEYIPKLTYSRSEQSPIVDIYLVKDGMDFKYSSVEHNTSEIDNLTADLKCSSLYEIAYYFTKGYPESTNGAYTLTTGLDMYSGVGSDTEENFDNCKLTLEDNTSYYLIFRIANVNAALQDKSGYYWYVQPNSFSLTPVPEDQELTEAFDVTINKNVSYTAPTVTGVTVDGGVIKSSESGDGTFTLTADAEKDGNKFLYWAKGKTLGKKIISFSNELTNYMPEANDKNHILIAVYEGDVSEQEEWYNANGQRIATGTEPEKLPSMAGYGEAEGWEDYSDKIHVARYTLEEPKKNIDITVTGGDGTGTYAYGDTVTCTATGENFKCWTKTGINGNTEIVSVDETYIFRAWETCTVEAIYQDEYTYTGNTMKIILDEFDAGNEKAVMAEFIGFGNNAVEKGIIWNSTKIAMTKPGTQFTLMGNAGDTFTGYAIVDNGDGTHSEVTDGSITIAE